MKHILLVNDDGYEAAGIWAMQRSLVAAGYDVTFVAPKTGQSWAGKSMLHSDNATHTFETIHDQEVHIIDATPAACVRIALYDIVSQKPDMVISGINYGGNHSLPILFSSGTFGAAAEAAFDGIPSIAVSLSGAPYPIDKSAIEGFNRAANITVKLLQQLNKVILPKDVDVLNLNIPFEIKNQEIAICKNNRIGYERLYKRHSEDKVSRFSKIYAEVLHASIEEKSDTFYLKQQGRPTLTPINLDLSSDKSVDELKSLIKGG